VCDDVFGGAALGQIAVDGGAVGALCGALADDRGEALTRCGIGAARVQHHGCARRGKPPGQRGTDAGAGTGDQHYAVE